MGNHGIGTHRTATGVVSSVAASALFGVLFLLPPLLDSLSGSAVFGWRVVVMLPLVTLLLLATGRWHDLTVVVMRVRQRPAVAFVLVIDALLLGVQLWLFGWAPQSGHGLDAALGYLLLPVVMVVVGILVYRERLSLTRGTAVAAAGIGVLASIGLNGGLSWLTLVVALGYPLYFTLRTHWRLNGTGALVLELAVLTPCAVWLLVSESALTPVMHRPTLALGVALLGIVGALALALYLAASRSLPFVVFGLLGYIEPLLLVMISIAILGEPTQWSDAFVCGPLASALILLGVEPLRNRRKSLNRNGTRPLSEPIRVTAR